MKVFFRISERTFGKRLALFPEHVKLGGWKSVLLAVIFAIQWREAWLSMKPTQEIRGRKRMIKPKIQPQRLQLCLKPINNNIKLSS